ncbi:lipid II flippase MurJ [Kineococcus sp. SYSU DK004]|uniref:lipid II flippase MurJ n=1 Tax=Kineococcus sp. SYSU DK004 TaxID=3383125 RepID=UPI003D7D8480
MAARLAGFGRLVAFSQTVGDTCLGTAYQTANQVPNVLFEVVAGGALAGVLVPVLSARLASGDPRERAAASRTASFALTWSVLALILVAGLAALAARPLMGWLLAGGAAEECRGLVGTGVLMLWVFLPQVPLYAVAVVLAGALQAQQRFTAPAAAPLVSSVVVAGAYLVTGRLAPAEVVSGDDLADVPAAALAVLAGGTTVGVVALALTHAPALRSAVRWRPALTPAPGDGPVLRTLALSGLTVLLAQQVVAVALTRLANDGGAGAVNRWSYAWALFLLPYAVLAVPVATAVFPRLARAAVPPAAGVPAAPGGTPVGAPQHPGAGEDFAALVARTARTVVVVSAAGAAALAAVAQPVAAVFVVVSDVGSGLSGDLAGALVAAAPGLVGYGLLALLTRALYTVGGGRAAALATVAGWALVLAAAVAAARVLPPERLVTGFAAAHTVGLTLAGLLLALALRRRRGSATVAGVARTGALAVPAAAAAGAGGAGAAAALTPLLGGSLPGEVLVATAAAAVAGVLVLALLRLLLPGEVAPLLAAAARVLPARVRRAARRGGR